MGGVHDVLAGRCQLRHQFRVGQLVECTAAEVTQVLKLSASVDKHLRTMYQTDSITGVREARSTVHRTATHFTIQL